MRWRWAAAVLVGLMVAGCGSESTPSDGVGNVDVDVPVDVAVDAQGRPYDAPASWWTGHRTETRLVGEFQVADGELRVMDGIALAIAPRPDEAQSVSFGSIEVVDLSVVWEIVPKDGVDMEAPLGIRLDVPGREVERWGSFEYAYGTDGGTGGVTSGFVLTDDLVSSGAEGFLDIDFHESLQLFDLDGDGASETLIFSNGSGDGGFPMSRGTSADGEIASLMIWDTRYPWRLAVPDGTPPAEVTHREDEMIECIEGRRAVDRHGFCQADDLDD